MANIKQIIIFIIEIKYIIMITYNSNDLLSFDFLHDNPNTRNLIKILFLSGYG